ncbi:amino acid adenylation domain-containing protein [Bradyrhizobium sp. CB1650]|uniref:amino acid adenylation domain-containing protein n=1 Tax=Bradyrhizobium sp. CB1650 TaxID=3039153 RepID=UPI002435EB2B|nr:amino acid adenylation domain-containing protein [Bradyrhizobium sp. CB1650]WGD52053.1 amino acid adenylation domain-containing protein [Bradyrhizobium sp. CB1650]
MAARLSPVVGGLASRRRNEDQVPPAYNLGLKFEQIVKASPSAPALLCEGRTHDFRGLNELANRFARWLAARGVVAGQVVCLELPKIVEAYALAIACLKLGAPYAYLDPAAPGERARLMLARCAPALTVSTREGEGPRVVIAGEPARAGLREELEGFAGENLAETGLITGTDPAYVMFTSGSTGEPKGVVIPHQGVLHLVDWAHSDLRIGPGDRLTNVNPIYFDNSVFDIYAGLLNGAAIVALDALRGRRPADLVDEIARSGCTFFFAVPTLFMYLDSMNLLTPDRLPGVRRFMFGGEGFPLARLRRFYDAFAGRALLINCYGPTETSCICSGFEITAEVFRAADGLPPLGRLNPNFSYRILDEELRPVAPGSIGELWLGGPCVGLGYINNPDETARRFRQDPLTGGHRSVLYRTGDLVELEVQSGLLRFRGRADNQVKLHGYRVELEEIDHAIASYPGITRALTAVLQDGAGPGRLVAAYSGAVTGEADLAAHCKARLPAYMVPSRFVWLEAMPTNANGKADRRAVAAALSPGSVYAKAS